MVPEELFLVERWAGLEEVQGGGWAGLAGMLEPEGNWPGDVCWAVELQASGMA